MSHRSALAQLRAQRASGKSRLESYQIEDQGAIYDEVDEDGYKKVVRSRLDKDDFVVDDNGEGYADDGREEWQNDRQYYSSDGEDIPLKGKAAKRKREEDREKEDRSNHKILNYFNNGPVAAPKPKVCSSVAVPDRV
jgi:DNA polymerase alpha subunit A